MKYIIFLTFAAWCFICTNSVNATTYYVDQTSGNDDNLGTAADQAWKTISKVNASSFSAGDSVLFKGGEIWREQLTIPSSGTSEASILFGAYGSGDRPQIYGSTRVTSWDNSDIPAGTGDVSDDGFEGTGYEETWTETIGSGSVVDEDSVEVAPPTDGGSQVIKIQKVSPNFNAKTVRDLGAEQATTYTQLFVYISAEGLANSQNVWLAQGFDGSNAWAWRLLLSQNASGEMRFSFWMYNNGTTDTLAAYPNVAPGSGAISLNTWYKIEVKYNDTDNTIEYRVTPAGGSLWSNSKSLTGAHRTGVRYLQLGDADNGYTATFYEDRFAVNTTGYLSESQALSANVWKSAVNSAPGGVWFTGTNGTVYWGDKESQLTDLAAQYDWYQGNNYLFTYATTDPTALYSNTEVSTRDYGIYANNKSYLTIENIETGYANWAGIKTLEGQNIIIQNNLTHHTGDVFGTGSIGRSLWTSGTDNVLIASNTVHNSALSGIWTYTGSNNNSGITIENNIAYDNGHTNIDVLCSSSTALTISDVTIRYNNAYFTSAYPNLDVGSNNYYVSGQNSCTVSSVNIYHNLGYNAAGAHLSLNYNVVNTNIYNNTFVGSLPGINVFVQGISIDSVADGTTGVTLKNNTVQDVYSGVGGGDRAFGYEDINSFSAVDYNNWYQAAGGTRIYAGLIGVTSYHFDDFAQYKSDTGFDTHGFWENPILVSTSTSNLRLLHGSPFINSGASVGLTIDYAGTSVPQGSAPDIGAYEYIPLTVTVNQAVGQSDPTASSTINFTAVFSESVSDFATGDVTLSGTAGATTAIVTGSGTTYNIAVSGMATSGTVLASIAADEATGSTYNTNESSTSSDNTVTYSTSNPPVLTSISILDSSGYTNDSTPAISVVSSNSPSHVAFSCNGGLDWSDWVVYSDSISSFDMTNGATGCLSSDGLKTITAKLKNSGNEESGTVNDLTYYDTAAPTIPGEPSASTGSEDSTPAWTWTASSDSGSGLATSTYSFWWCGNLNFLGCDSNTASSETNSFTHSSSLANGTWYVKVKAQDSLGQWSGYSTAGSVTISITSVSSGGGGGGGGYVYYPSLTASSFLQTVSTTPVFQPVYDMSAEERERLINDLREKLRQLLLLLIELLKEKIYSLINTRV